MRKQNPASVELLLNSTKRYLSRPEFRIQLEELFSQELHRLLAHLGEGLFDVNAAWSPDNFRMRVVQYEAAAEPLARMAGVVGRWGDQHAETLAYEVVQALYRAATKTMGGLNVWLALRLYPTVLIFTALGIGMTRAEKWSSLHRLFSAALRREHGEPRRAVEVLFLTAWEGGNTEYWRKLEGLERRKTPLSDHLLVIMSTWLTSFIGVIADVDLLIERFEVLGSLTYLETAERKELADVLSQEGYDRWIWTPVGRTAWHSSTRPELLLELQTDEYQRKLLAAGFARGDADFLTACVKNYARVAGRVAF
jgi:hypothetical protein